MKKKFLLIFILCVLVPLMITDSTIIYIATNANKREEENEMQKIVSNISYHLINMVGEASELAKEIYMSRGIHEFLEHEYPTNLDYLVAYQDLVRGELSNANSDTMRVQIYTDNKSILNGGMICEYKYLENSSLFEYTKNSDKGLCFVYDHKTIFGGEKNRQLIFYRRLNYFNKGSKDKVAVIKLDYNNLIKNLKQYSLNYNIYICEDNKIVLSNKSNVNVLKDYEEYEQLGSIGYKDTINLYGLKLDVMIVKEKGRIKDYLNTNYFIIFMLIVINITLPLLMMGKVIMSIINRLELMGKAMKSANSNQLVRIDHVKENDEITTLMLVYNQMVERINHLITIVYKNKIAEQNALVATKNAELKALYSQVNPHFLYNTLESIRMHCLIKKETETAEIVQKLALIERQYVEWKDFDIPVSNEIAFIDAYLRIQKYRFGNKLNYKIEASKECNHQLIPKLALATFVENACIHGIEETIAEAWIFVRLRMEENSLVMEVEDTGIGMTEEQICDLQDKIQNSNIDLLSKEKSTGIINASLRLKMFTNDKVKISIESEIGAGTTVTIIIPNRA